MTVYRFANPVYAHDLSGRGARLWGGRWNPVGIPVTYTSEHISLALLEMLVNVQSLNTLQQLQLVEISIPAHARVHEVKLMGLKKGWQQDFEYTQWMGREMLVNSNALIIKCPSAIIPTEHNILINPDHPDFRKVKAAEVNHFHFDERLFKHQPPVRGARVSTPNN